MKKSLRAILIVVLALVVVSSTFIVAYAETTAATGDDGAVITVTDGGGRAYELVWKYKVQNDHLWKRRWNRTLGEWYDPAWILVY